VGRQLARLTEDLIKTLPVISLSLVTLQVANNFVKRYYVSGNYNSLSLSLSLLQNDRHKLEAIPERATLE